MPFIVSPTPLLSDFRKVKQNKSPRMTVPSPRCISGRLVPAVLSALHLGKCSLRRLKMFPVETWCVGTRFITVEAPVELEGRGFGTTETVSGASARRGLT